MNRAVRLFAFVLCVLFVFSLTACTGGKGGATTNNNAGTAEEGVDYSQYEFIKEASAGQLQLFGQLKGTKIRIGRNFPAWEREFHKQLAAHYEMIVEEEVITSGEVVTKVINAVASGDKKNYFDVIQVGATSLMHYVYGNLVKPMDKYIDKNDPIWCYNGESGFYAPDLFTLEGNVYGCPTPDVHETYIFYNKTYFDERRIPDPYTEYYLKGNWTLETFYDVAEKATKKNENGKVEVYGFATWDHFSFIAATGNPFIEQKDNGKWECVIDQPNAIEALDMLYNAANNGYFLTTSSGYTEFANRTLAMIVGKPESAMGASDAYTVMTDEIGMVPMPKLDKDAEEICPLVASGYGITTCSRNEAGAAAYIYHYRIAQIIRNQTPEGLKLIANEMDEQAMERRNEYIKNCTFTNPLIDGLTGWYSDGRKQFMNILYVDRVRPAVAIDQLKPLVYDALRNTGVAVTLK